MKSFDDLIAEAESQPFKGWDFSYLSGRLVESPPPWDYQKIVRELLPGADCLVDLGTGGGELLASLHPLPRRTFATEGYPPNVPVAKRRLQPMGIEVIETFCDDNNRTPQRGEMPFRDDSVDLVIDRHESFIATEVFRVLKPSGWFVTQQLEGSYYPELNEVLAVAESPTGPEWNLRVAIEQIENAGFRVTDSGEARMEAHFLDVGAIVYYLKAVQGAIPGFSSKTYLRSLHELDQKIQRDGSFRVTFPLFFVQARKMPSMDPSSQT